MAETDASAGFHNDRYDLHWRHRTQDASTVADEEIQTGYKMLRENRPGAAQEEDEPQVLMNTASQDGDTEFGKHMKQHKAGLW
jgi:hypothetical protein